MSLVNDIKNEVKKAGTNKGKIMFFREGTKSRIRFLDDMEDGMKITFHDSFSRGVNVPCQVEMGKDACPYCEDDELRTREQYCWTVYDYDAKEVKLLLSPVNNCTPIPALMALFETYGTLTDRDYVISVTGKQQNKSFSVVPMDKNKFRNDKAKPMSESKKLAIVDKAFPADDVDDDDEDEKPTKKKSKSAPSKTTKPPKKVTKGHSRDEDEDDEDEEEDEVGEEEMDYSEMSAKELYKLCKERDIECEAKKPVKYYVRLLEENDKAQDDWEDEDDWEED